MFDAESYLATIAEVINHHQSLIPNATFKCTNLCFLGMSHTDTFSKKEQTSLKQNDLYA